MKLFNYSHARYAQRTLAKLRAKWPETTFETEASTHWLYPFRVLIRATQPDGRSAYVGKRRFT
jgi:hypothetical protein